MADEENKSAFLDILARGGEGMIDGLAKSSPILGGALQAIANTDEYQARQLERQTAIQRNKEFLQDAAFREDMKRRQMEENAEWRANAAGREDARRQEQEQRDEWRSRKGTREAADNAALKVAQAEGMKADEYMSPEAQAARKTANETAAAQNRLKLDLMDQQKFEERLGGMRKNLENELANNPMYSMMTFNERNAFLDSPAVRNMLEASGYMEDIMSMAGGDKDAFDRLDRALNRQGWDLKQGEDGIMYLDMGYGNMLPATKESIEAINKQVHDAALEELNARSSISMTASMGDPARRNIAKYANALMPYNNNSAAASLKAVQAVYNDASDEQKTWTFFNQALQDYTDPLLPTSAKMGGLQRCLPFLQQLGWAVEGFDEKNPGMDSVVLKNGKQILSFSQFADLCKSKDVISAQLDGMVERNQRQFGRDAILEAMKNVKDTGKAAKGKKAEDALLEDEAKKPEMNGERISIRNDLVSAFGADFKVLDEEQQMSVVDAVSDFNGILVSTMQQEGVKTAGELSQSSLKALQGEWEKMMDEIGIDDNSPIRKKSPVSNMIKPTKGPDVVKDFVVKPVMKATNAMTGANKGMSKEQSDAITEFGANFVMQILKAKAMNAISHPFGG